MADKPKDKEKAQRRVYMLPNDLVDRLTEYQRELGIASEAEAVRRILDNGLKSRDTPDKLIDRFLERLRETKDLVEISKDVLVGHPHITTIKFGDSFIEFWVKDHNQYRISSNAKVSAIDSLNGEWEEYLTESQLKARPKPAKPVSSFGRTSPARNTDAIDDDIPF